MQPSSAGAGTFERSDGPRSSMRSRSSFPGLLAFVFGAAVAAIPLAPAPARACYNEVVLKIDPNAVAVAEAETALKRGEPARAARRVLSRYSNLRSTTIEPTARDPLFVRSARILAVAIVRTDGRTSFGETTTWARAGNLEWAIATLREVSVWKQRQETQRSFATRHAPVESPDLAVDLGEALTMLSHTRAEGKKLLESLDRRDLLGSPYGYLALARVRAEAGEVDASRAAIERCKVRTDRAETCVVPLPPAKL